MATTGWHSHRHRRSHGPACKELGNYIHCWHWHFDLYYMIVQDCWAMEMNCVIQLLCSIDRQVIYPLPGDLPIIGIAQQSWLLQVLAQYLSIANAIGNGNVDSWMNTCKSEPWHRTHDFINCGRCQNSDNKLHINLVKSWLSKLFPPPPPPFFNLHQIKITLWSYTITKF